MSYCSYVLKVKQHVISSFNRIPSTVLEAWYSSSNLFTLVQLKNTDNKTGTLLNDVKWFVCIGVESSWLLI